MPRELIEGEIVTFRGYFYGPQVEKITIILHPTNDGAIDGENPVTKVKARVTDLVGNGQRFEAQLQAPRGIFNVIVFPALEGENNLVTIHIPRIEVISACAVRVKQLCGRIFPQHDLTITTSIGESLSYKAFKEVTPRIFGTLKGIYDDILLIEKKFVEIAQQISSTSGIDDQVWQDTLQLLEELFQQHGLCYLTLEPSLQQRLLGFLPLRMWNYGIMPLCECLYSHRPTPNGILNTLIDMVRKVLWTLGTGAPEFELDWRRIMGGLELARMKILGRDELLENGEAESRNREGFHFTQDANMSWWNM